MSRIWGMMDVGKRSLMNSQTALQTVGHNIANKSSEGYSRQRVEMKANVPVGMGRLRIGQGAHASKVTRINNPYLERQIEKEGNLLGNSTAKAETLSRVEEVFNEQVNKGLNKYMAEFFNSFRELSNNPESLAARTLVKESADFLVKDFRRVYNQLTSIQEDIDVEIRTRVHSVNELAREAADLNERIQVVELTGAPANDERDRRDQVLKELSEQLNIGYGEDEEGVISVTAGSSAVMVTGHSFRELMVTGTVERGGKAEGNLDIFYKPTNDSTPVNVTDQFTGGRLGGLLEVRDQVINKLVDRLDEMAFTVHNEVNKAHSFGVDRYNKKAGNFFTLRSNTKTDAAQFLQVSDAIKKDVGKIATAATPFAPADNRIANIIGNIQYKGVMDDGRSTVDQFYGAIVGEVGIQSQRSQKAQLAQDGAVKQLENIRESISGVSLDEETTKLIEYQKNFDASARIIRAADEMMDTVLNLKR